MLLGADQGADRRAGGAWPLRSLTAADGSRGPGLRIASFWRRPGLLQGAHCREEPALCSSQASAFVTEARPGVQMGST